jgi:GNAT superfamily N-acetyltransferase
MDIRIATDRDAQEIATVFRVSRLQSMPFLPNLHAADEDLQFVKERMLIDGQIVVACVDNKVIGFCAFREGWVDHLYLLPEFQRRGIGRTLLNKPKSRYSNLELWVFQRNIGAIAFHKNNGFSLVETTDGSDNEEGEPDARYSWNAQ